MLGFTDDAFVVANRYTPGEVINAGRFRVFFTLTAAFPAEGSTLHAAGRALSSGRLLARERPLAGLLRRSIRACATTARRR